MSNDKILLLGNSIPYRVRIPETLSKSNCARFETKRIGVDLFDSVFNKISVADTFKAEAKENQGGIQTLFSVDSVDLDTKTNKAVRIDPKTSTHAYCDEIKHWFYEPHPNNDYRDIDHCCLFINPGFIDNVSPGIFDQLKSVDASRVMQLSMETTVADFGSLTPQQVLKSLDAITTNFLAMQDGEPSEKSVLVTSVHTLIRMGANLLTEGSWEQRASTCLNFLIEASEIDSDASTDPSVKELLGNIVKRFSHLVIRISPKSIIYVFQDEDRNLKAQLFYEAKELSHSVRKGLVIGYTSILTISVLENLAKDSSSFEDALQTSLKLGIKRCSAFETVGYCKPDDKDKYDSDWPNHELLASIDGSEGVFYVDVPADENWTIVDQRILSEKTKGSVEDEKEIHLKIGRKIILDGIGEAQEDYGFPLAVYGKAKVIDSKEFQQYAVIRSLMIRYLDGAMKDNKPLCLSVFGKPGGGKSFGVKQLAGSMGHSRLSADIIEANVSQFQSLKDLTRVFHEARDVALGEKIPLVMLDEFDCSFQNKQFGWLQYFLMPMQDGKFLDGENEFHLGQLIFVFVGGINHSFDIMEGRLTNEQFIRSKGPDFISRLRGFLNVRGVDEQPNDLYSHIFQRAVMIREWFQKYHADKLSTAKKLEADNELLNALLTVDKFKHGTRSLEAIISMLRVEPYVKKFSWASLPSHEQLEMHIPFRKLDLARQQVAGL